MYDRTFMSLVFKETLTQMTEFFIVFKNIIVVFKKP